MFGGLVMAQYTIKQIAQIIGVSYQTIYKKLDNDSVLREVSKNDKYIVRNGSTRNVYYGEKTLSRLREMYSVGANAGDFAQANEGENGEYVPEKVRESVECGANEDENGGMRAKTRTPSNTTDNTIINTLKEEIIFLKKQIELAQEREKETARAMEKEREHYLTLLEKSQEEKDKLIMIASVARSDIKLLEEENKKLIAEPAKTSIWGKIRGMMKK